MELVQIDDPSGSCYECDFYECHGYDTAFCRRWKSKNCEECKGKIYKLVPKEDKNAPKKPVKSKSTKTKKSK